jgi:hypothetical protein
MSSGAGTGGYSSTPLARKIGVKPGDNVHLFHAPEHWEIPDLPAGCTVTGGSPAGAEVTLAFYGRLSDLANDAVGLERDLADHAMLWVAWPRRAAGHSSDITDNRVREVLLPLGIVDVKIAALGEDWSGMKLVRRKALRGKT